MTLEDENRQRVVKIVQELLLNEENRSGITPSLIVQKIDMVVAMMPRWGDGLDRDAVIDELIRRFSLWIGQDTTIKSEIGHEPWLNSARKRDWRYWQRYQEWLESKLSWKAVDALDRSTDSILELLEDPVRKDTWDRRGLVVGHVQSGKTSSYTGLICKAADSGYKIIIVLAGMHNNLRAQTQVRLDEGFLGFATNSNSEIMEYIGVGKDGRDANIKPNCATNRSDKGDFTTKVARHLAITPEQLPWLFVVKKNKTVLLRLLDWVRNHAANSQDPETGRRIVNHLPLLIIDDEADHASVDTGEQVFDSEHNPDEDYQPKAINSLVRKILNSFSRSAYVGYTATPFANIFIHERGETREEGPDLFPSAFIINLAAPSTYIGPAKVFGLSNMDSRQGGLPLVRVIDDFASSDGRSGWIPPKHKNGHIPLHNGMDELPPSLQEALDAFLLTCAIRYLRGQENEHSSMLVHVTRFNSVQQKVFQQVDEYLTHQRQRIARHIDDQSILARLNVLWKNDFLPTTNSVRLREPDQLPFDDVTWDDIIAILPDAISDIEVRMINGTSKDALDYTDQSRKGLKVIAIGGDKLARGLTLEGLCISYFLRASKMYDTLMQMGRWFGYRPGYLDLSRLYITSELSEWFGHIADAAEELREEFDLMAASGATPREYGLKVQSHPVLMVTSRLKMRTAKNLMLSFSGQLIQTVALHYEKSILERNFAATRKLISDIGDPIINPEQYREGKKVNWQGYLWSNVEAYKIIDFFSTYSTHPDAHRVNGSMLAEFVESMTKVGQLTSWTIALIGIHKGQSAEISSDITINLITRENNNTKENRYSIKTLISPRDESIDLNELEWNAALSLTNQAWHSDPGRLKDGNGPKMPSGPAIRKIRGFGADKIPAHPERGLLLIYALDPKEAVAGFPEDAPPVIAFGISFPGSDSGVKVEYKVNNVLWEQEYGSAE